MTQPATAIYYSRVIPQKGGSCMEQSNFDWKAFVFKAGVTAVSVVATAIALLMSKQAASKCFDQVAKVASSKLPLIK